MCGRARPGLVVFAAGARLAVLLQPLRRVPWRVRVRIRVGVGPGVLTLTSPQVSVPAALAKAGGGEELVRLEPAQPALAVRVVVPRVEPPAHGQPAEGPAVAHARVGPAAVAALLSGADAVGEPPIQQLAVTARVRVLATGQLGRHGRAVAVVRVALSVRTALLGEGLLLRAWCWAEQDGGCEHPKDGRHHNGRPQWRWQRYV